MSMGTGEYVSVSTQRDSEKSILRLEAKELEAMPETEERELAAMYEEKGLDPDLARKVAAQLTEHDALGAHADVEFGIDPDDLTNPWHAAVGVDDLLHPRRTAAAAVRASWRPRARGSWSRWWRW